MTQKEKRETLLIHFSKHNQPFKQVFKTFLNHIHNRLLTILPETESRRADLVLYMLIGRGSSSFDSGECTEREMGHPQTFPTTVHSNSRNGSLCKGFPPKVMSDSGGSDSDSRGRSREPQLKEHSPHF